MGIEFQWFSTGTFLKCIVESGCIKRKEKKYVNNKSEVFYICMFFATVPFFKTVLEFRFFCLGVKGKLSMKSAYM